MRLIVFSLIFVFSVVVDAIENSPICINRSAKVEADFLAPNLIKIIFSNDLRSTLVKGVYGVDGLKVNNFVVQRAERYNQYLLEIEYSQPRGLAYIVLNLEYDEVFAGTIRKRKEVISLPVGELSPSQIKKRFRNIHTYKLRKKGKNGSIGSEIVDIDVQELPLKRVD